MRRTLPLALVLALAASALPAAEVPQDLRFGLRVPPTQWGELTLLLAQRPVNAANPVTVTLVLPEAWAMAPDWTAFQAAVGAASASGARLAVTTELPAGLESPEALSYLVALSEKVAGQAGTLGIELHLSSYPPELLGASDRLALDVKRLCAALRGSGSAKVYLGRLDETVLPSLEPLYERDLRAYVDGYIAEPVNAVGGPPQEVRDFLEKHHPGAPLWVHQAAVRTPLGAQLLALSTLSRGVDFVDLEATPPLQPVWDGLLYLRAAVAARMGVGFATEATGIWEAGRYRADVGVLNFLDADTYVQGMLLVANRAESPKGTLEVILPTADVADVRAYALPAAPSGPLAAAVDAKKNQTVLKVPWQGTPVLVLFARLKTGTVGEERVAVSAEYRIPVELILARHQAYQQAQDVLLENYVADARVDYHFKLPGGTGSLDLTFLNTFFFEKGTGARWVQNQLLLNGVAWKGKKLPELPVIEPEKVNTLPLALTLGKDYSYKYLRDEAVEGRDCYVVEFIPLPEAKGSLYEGRVWIDKRSYAKVKMVVRQTRLVEPQVSNEETDIFEALPGPAGRDYRVMTRVKGQQIFSVIGRNVVAEREIRFTAVRLNVPDFRDQVARAEASDRLILQDTEKGLRYLEKQPDGSRKVQLEPSTHRLFAVGGAYYDQSLDYPLPLAGVNYFDYNWRKTKTQVNLFVAGAVNTASISKVNLFPKVDGRLDALVFLIPFQDKEYVGGREDEAQRLKVLREQVSGGLGWRPTQFSKLSFGLDATYYRFRNAGPTDPGDRYFTTHLYVGPFTAPRDHADLSFSAGYDYSRRGWQASLGYEGHRRSRWDAWGYMAPGTDVSRQRAYARWDATFSKTFYLPNFQKVGAAVTWLDGRHQDRFSRYEFTYMGKRSLSGFSGSGVRFDRGATARLLYEFNVADVVRFGVNVDRARVKPLRGADLWQSHTGLGVSGAVTGPWRTFWTLDLGYVLQSDIPAVRHKYTVALVVLKLW